MRTVLCRHGEIALDCDVYGKDARIEHLEAENKRLEADVKKAFWWSAENTMTIHANKIQLAWEDFNTYFRGGV